MRCKKAREFISDSLDARLDESNGLELAEHLAACSDCRTHQTVLAEGQALLRQDLVEPSDNFEWKVQLKIQQALRDKAVADEPLSGWKFWRPALASAASVALLVVVAGGVLLTRDDPTRSPSPASPAAGFALSQPAGLDDADQAEPDLSGAVRSKPLRVNAASGGFGIRTVADQGFVNTSPFPDPPQRVPVRWIQEGEGQSIEVREVHSPDGSLHYMVQRRVRGHGGNLKLELHGYKFREHHVPQTRHDDPDS
jgi:hypothetical protein